MHSIPETYHLIAASLLEIYHLLTCIFLKVHKILLSQGASTSRENLPSYHNMGNLEIGEYKIVVLKLTMMVNELMPALLVDRILMAVQKVMRSSQLGILVITQEDTAQTNLKNNIFLSIFDIPKGIISRDPDPQGLMKHSRYKPSLAKNSRNSASRPGCNGKGQEEPLGKLEL